MASSLNVSKENLLGIDDSGVEFIVDSFYLYINTTVLGSYTRLFLKCLSH